MDGISKALNTSFEMDKVSNGISIEEKVKGLETKSEKYKTNRMVLEDKEFIRLELMELIASTQHIKRLIEDELQRPPLKSTLVESYAMLNKEIQGYLRELRQLNNDVIQVELNQIKVESNHQQKPGGSTTNNVFFLDAKALDKMVNDAKANSMLNAIEVDFKIDNIK